MNPFAMTSENLLKENETISIDDFSKRLFFDIKPDINDTIITVIKTKQGQKLFTFSSLNILGGKCACCGYQFDKDDVVITAFKFSFKEK